MVKLTSKEASLFFDYEEYPGCLSDLPEGTAIQFQAPGSAHMHLVKQNNAWYKVTVGSSISSSSIEASSYVTITIL